MKKKHKIKRGEIMQSKVIIWKKENKINNQKYCYAKTEREHLLEIEDKIKEMEPIYNKKVWIKTREKEIETKIFNKYKKYLLTMSNEKIPIEDIIQIKRIS